MPEIIKEDKIKKDKEIPKKVNEDIIQEDINNKLDIIEKRDDKISLMIIIKIKKKKMKIFQIKKKMKL